MNWCDLHTILRLPTGIFQPHSSSRLAVFELNAITSSLYSQRAYCTTYNL